MVILYIIFCVKKQAQVKNIDRIYLLNGCLQSIYRSIYTSTLAFIRAKCRYKSISPKAACVCVMFIAKKNSHAHANDNGWKNKCTTTLFANSIDNPYNAMTVSHKM